jgi:hypothetical protein
MKKNLLYFLLLAGLGVAVYFLVINKSSGTLKESDKAFAVEDTASLGKIFIADMEGKKVVLERTNNGWTVNNKYPARTDYMNSLLSTLKRVTIGYPVPEAGRKTVITNMASENKKVELYDKSGKLIKSYIVGGPTLESNGTYMLMSGSEIPFVTDIPGFIGVLNTRYVTDEQVIRSTNIFNFKINDISGVMVNYTDEPDSTFTISVLRADSFSVVNGKGEEMTHPDKKRIREYLDHFGFVNAEAFLNDPHKKDSILLTKPWCSIIVTDRQHQPHVITIYHMPRNSTSEQFDSAGNELKYDVDRYYATINDGEDFVIIQQFHFGRLFKSYDYFRTSPKTGKTS